MLLFVLSPDGQKKHAVCAVKRGVANALTLLRRTHPSPRPQSVSSGAIAGSACAASAEQRRAAPAPVCPPGQQASSSEQRYPGHFAAFLEQELPGNPTDSFFETPDLRRA